MSKRPDAPFPLDGFTDREAECVEEFIEYCIELYEIEGKQLELHRDTGPILVRFAFEMLPDYSKKQQVAFCTEVTQRMHEAIFGYRMLGSGSA